MKTPLDRPVRTDGWYSPCSVAVSYPRQAV
jgi:hypothetical protein